jgi:hypothetical protein
LPTVAWTIPSAQTRKRARELDSIAPGVIIASTYHRHVVRHEIPGRTGEVPWRHLLMRTAAAPAEVDRERRDDGDTLHETRRFPSWVVDKEPSVHPFHQGSIPLSQDARPARPSAGRAHQRCCRDVRSALPAPTAQARALTVPIMPKSSCCRMWQWKTQRPGKSRYRVRMVISPNGGTSVVSSLWRTGTGFPLTATTW